MRRNTHRFALISVAMLALACSSVHADDKTAGTPPDASLLQQAGATVAAPAQGKTAGTQPGASAAASAPQPAASHSALPSTDPGTDHVDRAGNTALMRAAADGRMDSVKQLIADGSNVNYDAGPFKKTALVYAVENGHTEIVRFLLESGADANAVTYYYSERLSALFYAIKRNDPEIVQLLLAAGANPNVVWQYDRKWKPDRSAISVALGLRMNKARKKVINALLDNKPNLSTDPVLGWAMANYDSDDAAYFNDLIKRLIDGGADTNAVVPVGKGCASRGSTVLVSAVACGAVEVARLLIEGGADVNKVAESGSLRGLKPLNIAVERKGILKESGYEAVAAQLVEMLRAAGARE